MSIASVATIFCDWTVCIIDCCERIDNVFLCSSCTWDLNTSCARILIERYLLSHCLQRWWYVYSYIWSTTNGQRYSDNQIWCSICWQSICDGINSPKWCIQTQFPATLWSIRWTTRRLWYLRDRRKNWWSNLIFGNRAICIITRCCSTKLVYLRSCSLLKTHGLNRRLQWTWLINRNTRAASSDVQLICIISRKLWRCGTFIH